MDITKAVKRQYEKYPFPKDGDDTGFNVDNFVKTLKKLNLKGKTVLDMGCGTGFFSVAFALLGYKVRAVDISKSSIERAKRRAKEHKVDIEFINSDIFDYEDTNKYDIVFCWGVLHHTKDPKAGFYRLTKFVKEDGMYVTNIFNTNFYNMRLARKLAALAGGNIEDRLKLVKKYKDFFLMLDFLWKYKDHRGMGDNTLIDLYCHNSAKYYSKGEVESWYFDNGFEVINNDGILQENYVGVRL